MRFELQINLLLIGLQSIRCDVSELKQLWGEATDGFRDNK